MAQLKTLISEPSSLAYVWVPKCASSTMFQVFQVLSGVPESEMRRRVEVTDEMLSQYGARRIQIRRHKIEEFAAGTNYTWFTIVRNPYDRLISNYNNKIDHFAEILVPELFEQHLKQITAARRDHKDIPKIRKKMQLKISFEDFVDRLHENGTNFDAHFIPQVEHINNDKVSYRAILKMETLQADLPKFLQMINIPAKTIDRAVSVPPRNQTARSKLTPAKLSVGLRDKIYELYTDDFEILGYKR